MSDENKSAPPEKRGSESQDRGAKGKPATSSPMQADWEDLEDETEKKDESP